MIVDPWGVVLDRLPRGSGVVVAGVNPTYDDRGPLGGRPRPPPPRLRGCRGRGEPHLPIEDQTKPARAIA